jgi:putative hydrolase of the HAD superfamily
VIPSAQRRPTPRAGRPAVVLFDLDDTLFAHSEAVAKAITVYRKHLGSRPGHDDSTEAKRWRALEELHYHRYLAGELDFLGQRRARARGFVAPYGHNLATDDDADAWFEGYFVHYESSWSLHDDAIDCLMGLRGAGLSVGIITNGELAFQRAKIERAGLASMIDEVIASGDLGFAKPDRRIFEHACARFGVAPSDAVYVGDRLETDALGAARAGLRGVWVDRNATRSTEDSRAARASGVVAIASLGELAALLCAGRG